METKKKRKKKNIAAGLGRVWIVEVLTELFFGGGGDDRIMHQRSSSLSMLEARKDQLAVSMREKAGTYGYVSSKQTLD